MKNIEKYQNTKDALDAYNKLKTKGVPFDKWLEREFEEPREPTLIEAASAVIDEWYYTYNNVISNDLGDKLVELKNAIEREKRKPVRNCDRPECATTKAAQELWRKEDGGKTAYYEWLLETSTKGEAK